MKHTNLYLSCIAIIFLTIGVPVHGQKATDDLYTMSLSDLMNIEIVSASKKAENNFDSPLSTTVLTRQEIINSGATTIGEALRLVPGLIVREETNGNYDIHQRGFDNINPDVYLNNTENTFSLVMIDSRVVYSYFQGGTLWESMSIDINDIERIEIIRGPASALYGPNAVNGVIHIITRRGEEKASVKGHFEAGNFSVMNGQLSLFTSSASKLSAGISGNYQVRDNYSDLYYVGRKADYYTLAELDTLTYTVRLPYPPFTNVKSKVLDDVDKYYPGGNKSLEKYGVNAYLNYKPNEKVDVDLSAGTQNSEGQMMTMQFVTFPSTRFSNTQYANLTAKTYGLTTHISYTNGEQNMVVGNPSFHYDFRHLEGTMEYDFTFKSLTLRPGVSYQSAVYDVSNYVSSSSTDGYFKGEATLNTLSGTLRGDYKMFSDKLRLIAALRLDKYNVPDKNYFSYQFIGTYAISENHMVRAGYSKANRSPFIISNYADYTYYPPYKIIGNQDLNLVTQNTVEAGIRNKWAENFQTDVEVFYADMKDFETTSFTGIPMASNIQYVNSGTTANQIGLTVNAMTYLTRDLSLKVYGTYQKTDMVDYIPNFLTPSVTDSGPNKWTPSFYGGLAVNWVFVKKANININAYYMSKQELNTLVLGVISTQEMDPTMVVNTRLSYKIYKNNEAFINIRNINGGAQFPYMKPAELLIMGGIKIDI